MVRVWRWKVGQQEEEDHQYRSLDREGGRILLIQVSKYFSGVHKGQGRSRLGTLCTAVVMVVVEEVAASPVTHERTYTLCRHHAHTDRQTDRQGDASSGQARCRRGSRPPDSWWSPPNTTICWLARARHTTTDRQTDAIPTDPNYTTRFVSSFIYTLRNLFVHYCIFINKNTSKHENLFF